MNMPADMGGMMDDMMGSGYYGDQSQNEDVQNNQMDLGDIGISSDMITEHLSDYIREVRVMVWWEEDLKNLEIMSSYSHMSSTLPAWSPIQKWRRRNDVLFSFKSWSHTDRSGHFT